MKKVVFVSNMSELGAGTRGSSLGFQALELAALKFGKRLFSLHDCHIIPPPNHSLFDPIKTPYAKHIDVILNAAKTAGSKISRILSQGSFPFVISADHSNAVSTVYAIKKAFPGKRLGVVWIDAHGDLHSPYTTPSGNMHGMPLAALLGEDNMETCRNDVDRHTVRKWNAMKELSGISPRIRKEDLVFFAVRDTESAEDHLISKFAIRNLRVEELRYRGIRACVATAMNILKKCDLIYISFDVDSMDCNLVSHGTGTPVENGLSPDEAREIMMSFMEDRRLVCIETVEINTILDEKGNKMAETTVRIIDNLIRKYQGK